MAQLEPQELKQLEADLDGNLLRPIKNELISAQQRISQLENRLSGYDVVFRNHNDRIDACVKRIEILEEARKIQMRLNANIPVKIEPKIEAKIDVNNWLSKFLKK